MSANIITLGPTTGVSVVQDDRRSIVYGEGAGTLGRIEVQGAFYLATRYIRAGVTGTRVFNTHRHAVAAFKYGADWRV